MTIDIKETIPAGNYKITAKTSKDDSELDSKTFNIPVVHNPTATISEEVKYEKYKASYEDLGEYTKIIEFKDTGSSTDVDQKHYTKSEEDTAVTVNVKKSLPVGTYKIIAKTSKEETELATKQFTIPKTTAKITKQTDKMYHIDFENLRENTVDIKLVKKEEQTEMQITTDYTLVGSEPYVLTIQDTVEAGEYQIKAGIKGGETLATEDVTIE